MVTAIGGLETGKVTPTEYINDNGPYKVTDDAYKALIELLVDICKRNNIKKLKYCESSHIYSLSESKLLPSGSSSCLCSLQKVIID